MEAAKKGGVLDLSNLGILNTEDALEELEEREKEIKEMEIPWEQRLQEQREKDQQEKYLAEREKILENKKAPHLTNLNEDTQLTGKLYYSLANLAN